MINLKIHIEKFQISLIIKGDDELKYRYAGKILKDKLNGNKLKFQDYTKERLLRITAFHLAKECIKSQHALESNLANLEKEIPITMSAGRLLNKYEIYFREKYSEKSSETIYMFVAYQLALKIQTLNENNDLKNSKMETNKNVRNDGFSAYNLLNDEKTNEVWTVISEKEDIDWTADFIEKNKGKINWKSLSFNDSLPWSIDLITQFESYWNWHALSYIIANNKQLDRTEFDMLLIQYKTKVDWKVICQGTNIKTSNIETYSDFINWDSLSSNNKFVWSESFVNNHVNDINWKVFTECLASRVTPSLMQTTFRKKVLDMYSDKLDFGLLSENDSFDFTREIIEKYKDRWNWIEIINNPAIKWNKSMLKEYNEYISTIKPEDIMVSFMWTSIIEEDMEIEVLLALL